MKQYYANKHQLMEAESSDFVTLISINLGKPVLSSDCERGNVHKTSPVSKSQLRTRFGPKDFKYDLRERMFHLKQKETIHEYVSKFQDLLSQTELGISELENQTAKKNKEESPGTQQDAIEIASNFEFAHSSGKPPRTPSKQPNRQEVSSSRPFKPKQQPAKCFEKKGKKSEWTKTAKCNNCGEIGHISPQCKKPKNNKSNTYMSESVYAILEIEAQAYKREDQETNVSIVVDNGSSLNGVTEEFVKKLELEATEHEMMHVDLGYDQIVHCPSRTVEMSLAIPGFPVYSKTCLFRKRRTSY
ncbi:hypothetical protein PHMEG_0007471 [Phytophthora megakarya]|uniref:CCHC-type domain-containing protein n=1 Tax=Phytophthora megakarya TaxID=4795 RepID=A0A225WL58_9STRA|nr:hypothetical protein PHMEG_0007471 [Phytophthora megakarya]